MQLLVPCSTLRHRYSFSARGQAAVQVGTLQHFQAAGQAATGTGDWYWLFMSTAIRFSNFAVVQSDWNEFSRTHLFVRIKRTAYDWKFHR